jgi:uncharacterized small protein (DUF1192 family)
MITTNTTGTFGKSLLLNSLGEDIENRTPIKNIKTKLQERKSTPYVFGTNSVIETTPTNTVKSILTSNKIPSVKFKALDSVIVPQSVNRKIHQRVETPYVVRSLVQQPNNEENLVRIISESKLPLSVQQFLITRRKHLETANPKSTTLRAEIQRQGLLTSKRRNELLEILEDAGLNSLNYSRWTVDELEQRVLGLQEETIRAGAEALLIEVGEDPQDFSTFTVEEIETWIETQIEFRRIPFNTTPKSYLGTKIEFVPTPESFKVIKDEKPNVVEKIAFSVAHWTCEQLRTELKKRGLKVAGLKSVLVERLEEDENKK